MHEMGEPTITEQMVRLVGVSEEALETLKNLGALETVSVDSSKQNMFSVNHGLWFQSIMESSSW